MSVPTNLIPTRITALPEYAGTSQDGYVPYVIDGRTFKVQFAQIAATSDVPTSRAINTGVGLAGGGNLTQDRTIYIANEGVGFAQLDKTGVTAGSYGTALNVPTITVDDTGRVTGVVETPIVLPQYVPTSRTITAGSGLTGGGDLSANRTLAINFSSATPQSLGAATAGTGTQAAREDHVHPAVDLSDTTETQGVLPLVRGGTGNALSPVAGAVVYSGSDGFYLTDTGTLGYILTSGGPGGVPTWEALPSGSGTVTSVSGTGTVNGITLTGTVTTSGSLTLGGTLSGVSLTTQVTGTLPVANGGTGATTAADARVNLLPSYAGNAGKVLALNVGGTDTEWVSVGGTGTVTSVDASGGTTGLTFTGGPITTSGTLTLGGTLAVASGGTGSTTAAGARSNLGAAASGANSDITSLSGITGSISTVDSILFDTTAGVTVGAGRLAWNADDGTLDLGMGYDAVTQQIGLEQYLRIKASAAITNGQCVMFTGAVGASGVLTGAPATGVTNPQYIMGVATMDIALNGFGYVTSFGLVRGIDTTGTPVGEVWADGDILYYNPAYVGGLTKVEPLAPTPKVVVAAVASAGPGGSGSLFVRIQAEPYLQGLTDVYAPSPISNGQILIGDGGQSRWESATLTAGTNVSITNGAGSITINATDQYVGTVTSVAASGGTTGLTFTGSPITTSGTLTLGGTLGVANGGTGATTLTGVVIGNGTSAFTTVTAPSGAIVGTTDTQTLTNKRLTSRVNAQTTTSSPWAWNSDSYDQQSFSALANALTINADAGTPTDGQKAMFRFKDDGTARALTWTTGSSGSFRAIGVTLPTTTVANKTTYVGCIYNSADSRWDAVAVTTEA